MSWQQLSIKSQLFQHYYSLKTVKWYGDIQAQRIWGRSKNCCSRIPIFNKTPKRKTIKPFNGWERIYDSFSWTCSTGCLKIDVMLKIIRLNMAAKKHHTEIK